MGNGYYQLDWLAASSLRGLCRRLELDLGDGVPRRPVQVQLIAGRMRRSGAASAAQGWPWRRRRGFGASVMPGTGSRDKLDP